MKTSFLDVFLCTLATSALLAATFGVVSLLAPATTAWLADYHVIVDFLLFLLVYGVLSALLVRLLLAWRPIEPHAYAMDSPVCTYWKLLTIVYRLGEGALVPFTPMFLQPVVEALFGARIGANVALGGKIDDPYLVTIGDGSVLGNASLVSANMIHGGQLTCGRVTIGAGVTIGANSVVLPGTTIGDNVTLMAGSYVMPNTTIPAGETWRGNPARKWQ